VRTTVGRRRHHLQNALVVSTVALAFVLLVGAGLFMRSFSALLAADPGFRPARVLITSLALPREAYPDATSVRGFHRSLLDRAAALPGIRSAASATDVPLETAAASSQTRSSASIGRS